MLKQSIPWMRTLVLVAGATLALTCRVAWADESVEPLHARIDVLIDAGVNGLPAAEAADDAEFLRRACLDFAGRIPTSAEARTFLADAAADKRQRLIDDLLAGPDYPRRMQEAFNTMLMERLGENADWNNYLRTAFAENRPWDQVVRQILSGDADDQAARGAAFFLSKRLENYGQQAVDLPGLTRDVGRMFLGVDLQCAQCHNHLFIDDYSQHDFQGLFAFVGHAFPRTDKPYPAVGENVVQKKIEFMSVFTQEPRVTGPRLPDDVEFDVPAVEPGQEFAIPPDRANNMPGVPRFSPLRLLGERLPRPDNPLFARNTVNRLWYLLFGRGIVHPLDLHHSGNPPSHPELLDLLAAEFAGHGCDVKWLLREMALTRAYGRSSLLPEGVADLPPDRFLVFNEKPLSAEQLFHSASLATGMTEAIAAETEVKLRAEDPRLADLTGGDATRRTEMIDAQLSAARSAFLAAFANPPREPETEFSPSVKAALFVLNGETVLGWLPPRPGNLTNRLLEMTDDAAVADELYLSVLARPACDEERSAVAEHLARHADDRAKALAQLAWALLASTEFCVNH